MKRVNKNWASNCHALIQFFSVVSSIDHPQAAHFFLCCISWIIRFKMLRNWKMSAYSLKLNACMHREKRDDRKMAIIHLLHLRSWLISFSSYFNLLLWGCQQNITAFLCVEFRFSRLGIIINQKIVWLIIHFFLIPLTHWTLLSFYKQSFLHRYANKFCFL